MPASSASHRAAHRLAGALCLAVLACVLLPGVIAATPAAAQQRAARTLSISVNKPGSVASGSKVTLRCRAKDQTGKAIRGVNVTFRWRLPEGTRTQTRTTNSSGVATAARVTTCGSASDYRARVIVTATWGGQTRKVTRYFIIIGGT